jgi:ABC-type transport system substrate-binding protein
MNQIVQSGGESRPGLAGRDGNASLRPAGMQHEGEGNMEVSLMRGFAASLVVIAAALAPGQYAAAADKSTLVWADAGEPSTIDPAKANIDWEITVTRNVYDELTTYNYDDPGKILPSLATSWTNDGTKWTFKLRQGVTFHNGAAFTADDVKASLDRMLRLGQGASYLIDNIKTVAVSDPHTVVIETKEPNVYLPANLSHIEILSAADIAAHTGDAGEAYFSDHANGTGPYKFVSWTRGSQIELERNTKWWGTFAPNAYNRIVDRFVAEGANRARGLEGGEFDLANYVPLDEAIRISKEKGFHAVKGHYLWAWPTIYLNTKLAPTDNPDLRAALAKAFDYDAMVQFYNGEAETPHAPIPEWYPGSPEKDLPAVKRDLDGAKAALKKSGLSNPSITCVIPAGFAEFAFAATVLQSSAAEIGINVQVQQAPFAEAIDAAHKNKSNCFDIGNASLSPTDVTKFFAAHYVTGAFFNTANYSNPEFDALNKKIPTVFDDKERFALVKQAEEIVTKANIIIVTARTTTVFPVPDHVAGYRVNPTDYTGVRFYELGAAK